MIKHRYHVHVNNFGGTKDILIECERLYIHDNILEFCNSEHNGTRPMAVYNSVNAHIHRIDYDIENAVTENLIKNIT